MHSYTTPALLALSLSLLVILDIQMATIDTAQGAIEDQKETIDFAAEKGTTQIDVDAEIDKRVLEVENMAMQAQFYQAQFKWDKKVAEADAYAEKARVGVSKVR